MDFPERLIEGYRELGHLTANLDPLGLMRRKLPPIALEDFGLEDADLDLVFSSENVAGPDRTTLRDLVGLLRETYSRTIGPSGYTRLRRHRRGITFAACTI